MARNAASTWPGPGVPAKLPVGALESFGPQGCQWRPLAFGPPGVARGPWGGGYRRWPRYRAVARWQLVAGTLSGRPCGQPGAKALKNNPGSGCGQTPKSPMPRHRGGIAPIPAKPGFPNRDSPFPESRNPGQIGIPHFPNPGIPAKSGFPISRIPGSRPNRDRGKIPIIFPIPAQSGSGKSRLFSRPRPNRGGTGRGFGDFGVWLREPT